MKRCIIFIVLIASFPLFFRGEALDLAKVGEWGSGEYNEVFVTGDYAYCAASGSGLDIIDISNPSSPVPRGKFSTTGGALGVYIRKNLAYVIDGQGYLEILDVSNPSFPIRVGISDIKAVAWKSQGAQGKILPGGKVKLRGDYAYVCSHKDIKIFNVSTPSRPTLLREFEINGVSSDISFRGNFAFVSTWVNQYTDEVPGVHVLDVTDPGAPELVGIYNNGYDGDAFGIDVEDHFAYMISYGSLVVLDIANPGDPVKLGSCDCFTSVGARHDIYVKGGYAYIAAYDGGVTIVDVSDPAVPALVVNYQVPGNANSLALKKTLLYTACGAGGLRILDVSTPGSPTLKGSYDVSGALQSLDRHGQYLYLARAGSSLEVLDVSNPSSPLFLGSAEFPGMATALVVSGGYAYVADEYEGLRIFDVANPAAPRQVGLYPKEYGIYDVFVDGAYAYVTPSIGGLDIVDISNPAQPVQVGTYDDTGNETGIYVRGDYAYLTLSGGVLMILDVSAPASPKARGACLTPKSAYDVYVSGNKAFVANHDNGLTIIDISRPDSPSREGTYDTGGTVYYVYSAGAYAYAADGKNGLLVLDISSPAAPFQVGHFDTPGEASYVQAQGDYIYVADGISGKLLILRAGNQKTSPLINLDKTRLSFASSIDFPNAGNQSQSISIENSGGGNLSWAAAADRSWLRCSPPEGDGSGEISVWIEAAGLSAGTYWGNITVTAVEALNSPQQVAVLLRVYESGQTSGPFGIFSTPTEGATVSGSIPVTGWLLDDLGVQGVQIFREQGKDLVYIDDAVFVPGARPDVEQVYPWYPMNDRAGWGYQLLTNFLPYQGNGTFRIHVLATDVEGNQVTLGVKTIFCDNANARIPFGALDTPRQGEILSDREFINFGWALTPIPNTVPPDGSTIWVWVDGVSLGNPVYNRYREDIASLFPGYNNSEGAGGYFSLDTSNYEDGIHTIAWSVTDDAGNTNGIGSRYFTLKNSDHRRQTSGSQSSVQQEEQGMDFTPLPGDFIQPMGMLRGYRQNQESREIFPDENGRITIAIEELERVEIDLAKGIEESASLSGDIERSRDRWSGFQVMGNQLRPLPIGSFLDTRKGVFYWQPGAGYLGGFQLVFIKKDRQGNRVITKMSITINPKF